MGIFNCKNSNYIYLTLSQFSFLIGFSYFYASSKYVDYILHALSYA